jgi:hypothetical protein
VSRISHHVWGSDDVAHVGDEPYVDNRQNAPVQISAVFGGIFAGQSQSLQRRRRQEEVYEQSQPPLERFGGRVLEPSPCRWGKILGAF